MKNVDFSAFGRYVFRALWNKDNIIIQYYLVPRRLSTDANIVSLNDLEWSFYVKF